MPTGNRGIDIQPDRIIIPSGTSLIVQSGATVHLDSAATIRGLPSADDDNVYTGTADFQETLTLATQTAQSGEGKLVIDPREVPLWGASRHYSLGSVVQNSTFPEVNDYSVSNANSFTYGYLQATAVTTGISGSVEPTWPGVGTTVSDGGITWTGVKGQRRIIEIFNNAYNGRTIGNPDTWFDVNGGLRTYRTCVFGGTSNGMTGEDFTLWPPMVPNTGAFGGSWLGVVADGASQVGFCFNGYIEPTTCWAFQIVDGTPLTPASQKTLFAIGRYGGLFWTGTAGGHTCVITQPDSDTAHGAIIQGDAASKCVYQGVGSNSASSVSGATAGGARTNGRGIYQKNAMVDNTATGIARVTIPNVEASAVLSFVLLSRAADGESTEANNGLITFNRKAAGSNVVATVGTLFGGPAESADGAQPITTAVTLLDNAEAAGATQTFDVLVTINTNNSAQAECTMLFDFINHQTGGATIYRRCKRE